MAAACRSRTKTSVFKLHNGTKSIRQGSFGLGSCNFMWQKEKRQLPHCFITRFLNVDLDLVSCCSCAKNNNPVKPILTSVSPLYDNISRSKSRSRSIPSRFKTSSLISMVCLERTLFPPVHPSSVLIMRTYATRQIQRSATHYYDILGLVPKATQKQIKSAYYKMSKVYHPDVAKDKQSNITFTEINEAYEVLGNIQKRRLYDRGLLHERDPRAPYNPDDANFTRAQAKRSPFERGERPPPPRGRSRVYNFDEFYRQHYNDVRERRSREWSEFVKQRDSESQNQNSAPHAFSGPLLLSFWIFLVFLTLILSDSHSHVMSKDFQQRRDAYLVSDSQQNPLDDRKR